MASTTPASVESSIVPDEASGRWRVRGASCFRASRACGEAYESGTIVRAAGAKFGLKFFPKGVDTAYAHCAGVSVVRLEPVKVWGWIRIVLIDQIAENHCVLQDPLSGDAYDFGTHQERRVVNFIGLQQLNDPNSGYMVDDVLIFELHLTAFSMDHAWEGSLIGPSRIVPRGTSLANDMLELLRTGEGSDIVVRGTIGACRAISRSIGIRTDKGSACDVSSAESGHSKPFHVHRSVLVARSPVFRRMLSLDSPMKEAQLDGEVVLQDVEPRVVGWLLHFMYSDEIDDEALECDDALCHLLAAAHKYEVGPLLDLCQRKISGRLTEDNAAERLMMADHLGVECLRVEVLDYICGSRKHLATVQRSAGYELLKKERPQLLGDIVAMLVPPAKLLESVAD